MIKKIFYSKLFLKINSIFYKYLKSSFNLQNEKIIKKKYKIIEDFQFNGENINIYGDGELRVNENSYIGDRSTIQLTEGTVVEIGKNAAISHNVRIYTSNRNPEDIIFNKQKVELKVGDVKIGNNCWVGANVFICQGIEIGDNCVIGANSVVSKSIPSNSIAAGAPIKILKSFNPLNMKG